MSSAQPPPEDLTARAKIRNIAVAHFARDGFQRANLRAIAAEAGVSIGLISHHFGSKDGLRATCDEHVLHVLTTRARTAGRPDGVRDLATVYLSNPEEYQVLVRYMARAIQEDVPAAGTFVNTLVEESEAVFRAGARDGTMRPSSDPRALAVLSVMVSMATLTMAPPLARALGHERVGPEVMARLALPALELYTHGLYLDDTPLKTAQEAWDATRPSEPQGEASEPRREASEPRLEAPEPRRQAPEPRREASEPRREEN
ncbi:TetR/AcrR family transcriptional regulator [Sphaerisporangium corydalis]|uniref:TetR family transcriptional regulator n=1 Tax=Sphaerisporangium corydalis TaxID=1441875 RepID=A0ABV9ER57_9ACTN|nr:TetR family transcriptional regulator [Sphaerisporangium corydalis]